MKAFKFRLRKVHELRERAERRAIEEVGRAQGVENAARAALDRLLARRRALESELTTALSEGALETGHVQRLHGDLEALEGLVLHARQDLVQAEWALEKARNVARRSRGERRATESLREKALERHMDDVRRAEQKDMDEAATARHVRGGSGS